MKLRAGLQRKEVHRIEVVLRYKDREVYDAVAFMIE